MLVVSNIAFEVHEFKVALCIGLMIKYHMQESIMEENENEYFLARNKDGQG